MDLRASGPGDAKACADRARELLGGSLFYRAELDLNVYHVLALNDDASISVVDPLFGYGNSKLLTMVMLKSRGEDWALTPDQSRLFVSMPDANQVAVVDTDTWKIIANLDIGGKPARVALQPDGHYLWVSTEAGVAVIDASALRLAATIDTGKGSHEFAFTEDNRLAFATNSAAGTVSVVDIRRLAKVKDVATGPKPVSIAYSSLSQTAWVADEADGSISVIDAGRAGRIARLATQPGLIQIRFAPGGRLGFAVNPKTDHVHILDSASNRLLQTGQVERGPDQVTFSDTLAYIRHRESETVLMIPLAQAGAVGRPVPVVDFPGGRNPLGKWRRSSPADSIVQAPGENGVLVANPADQMIYYYKEGLAAPMGSFTNYSRQPRAVLVVDRTLRPRGAGIYETTAKLRRPGDYALVFVVDSPRLVHCFDVKVDRNPEIEDQKRPRVAVEWLGTDRPAPVGQKLRVRFRLTDPETKVPRDKLTDVHALAILAPGIWQTRMMASPIGQGNYEIEIIPPKAGLYEVFLECPSLGLPLSNPQYLVLEAK